MVGSKPRETGGESGGISKWWVLAVLGAAQFIIVIDTTIMNVSISNIVADLNTNVTGVQAAVTLYSLVMASFMITGAKMGGRWGRRRAFALGTILFALGSGITGFAWNLLILTLGWSVVEGLGSALMMPAIWSLLTINYRKGDRAVAMAVVAGIAAAAAALGPIIGGWITSTFNWRWAFRLEVVVALGVLLGTRMIKDEPVTRKPHLDALGVLLSASGLGCTVFGILRMSSWGLVKPRSAASPRFLGLSPSFWLIVGGISILALFTLWEMKQEKEKGEPLIRMTLLRNWSMSSALCMYVINNVLVLGLLFTLPLYMQKVLELDALQTGIGLLPLSLAILLASFVAPRLSRRFYPAYLVTAGAVLETAGCLLLMFYPAAGVPDRADMIAGLCIVGLGIGCVLSQVSNMVMSSAPADAVDEASALNSTAANLGNSIGTALLGAVLIAALAYGIVGGLQKSSVLTPQQQQTIAAAVEEDVQVVSTTELEAALSELPAETRGEIVDINEEATRRAFGVTLIAASVTAGIAFLLSLFLPKRKFT
jgi:EmrB/QacA subfamily drug resistance transporter